MSFIGTAFGTKPTAPALLARTIDPASVTPGAAGRLQAWFDWNRDGDFLDAGEQVATNVGDNLAGDTNAAAGIVGLSFTVPAAATPGLTFARFRWSTQTGLDPTTIVGHDGEVEDYAVTVLGIPILNVTKTSALYAPASPLPYFLPGNDVIYTITATNNGTAATDADTVFVLDSLPSQVEVYVSDFDAGGPATGTILFSQQNGTTLTFAQGTDVRFSNQTTAPASFAQCTYAPTVINTYDPAIRHICLNPKGTLAASSPAHGFAVQFRTRIR